MRAADRILASRKPLVRGLGLGPATDKSEMEGGCGVVGFAISERVPGRHIIRPSLQMHNRGNGKGGGIAAAGLSPAQMRVSPQELREDYLFHIAFLDPLAQEEVEQEYILPNFQVHQAYPLPTLDDHREASLEVKPPQVFRYFLRAREERLAQFMEEGSLSGLPLRQVEDEFVYQESFRLNQRFYASLGEKRAFILSHGRDFLVLKGVGYAEQVARYYLLEDLEAHVWIAHQRYPTKGKVWHPGGAHPFVGQNEALVHNGDFANYRSVCDYLAQRNVYPLFLTDTEVSVLLFDLWSRVYGYPLEYCIEALAPTTERDFTLLPPEKKEIYSAIQSTHIHGSPDGPWFFIIARSLPEEGTLQLLGITDTSMLRPQVFALQEGEVQIGLIASEKQALDATLASLAAEDRRICPKADRYWNARGGSHTDGGAFMFSLRPSENGQRKLVCTDKFGRLVSTPQGQRHDNPTSITLVTLSEKVLLPLEERIASPVEAGDALGLFQRVAREMRDWEYRDLGWFCQHLARLAERGEEEKAFAIAVLTLLHDRRYDTGAKKRSSVLARLEEGLEALFRATSRISANSLARYQWLDWQARDSLCAPQAEGQTLVIDVAEFPAEGEHSASRTIVEACKLGWRRFLTYGWRGQRFCGCGLGPESSGVRIEVYGSSGDYLGSGLDGAEVIVHGDGQDQLGQILKRGKLVAFGDVGQTFMYGAKGGEVYVMGNAAGRPLINAVGRPRVVINGTCLDYLAESFMAGDALQGGGFVILNGVAFDEWGRVGEQATPYPGGNLFSLASGGAIYIRDPHHLVGEDQLNGGEFAPLTAADWKLILPYLQENERLFGISIEGDLLTVQGTRRSPEEVYRKVRAVRLGVLT